MNYDPNGNVPLLLAAGAGAFFEIITYLLDLGSKYGSENIRENVDLGTLAYRGAIGAGLGIVGGYTFSKAGLSMIEKAFTGLHLLPAAYALTTPIDEYSGEGLLKSAVFSILGDEGSTIYKAIQNIISESM